MDVEHFEVLSVNNRESGPTGGMVGAPIQKTWMIRAKKKGISELRFIHFRPWEGDSKTANTVLVKVRIL
jgi:predicted secreted protein